MPINQRGGIQTLDELGDRLRFETVKDYEDWVARLARVSDLDGPEHRAHARRRPRTCDLAEDRA